MRRLLSMCLLSALLLSGCGASGPAADTAGAPDIYHYDSKSMIQLGRLFGQALLEKYLEK